MEGCDVHSIKVRVEKKFQLFVNRGFIKKLIKGLFIPLILIHWNIHPKVKNAMPEYGWLRSIQLLAAG